MNGPQMCNINIRSKVKLIFEFASAHTITTWIHCKFPVSSLLLFVLCVSCLLFNCCVCIVCVAIHFHLEPRYIAVALLSFVQLRNASLRIEMAYWFAMQCNSHHLLKCEFQCEKQIPGKQLKGRRIDAYRALKQMKTFGSLFNLLPHARTSSWLCSCQLMHMGQS